MIPDTLKASNDDLLKIQNPFTVYKNGDIKNNFKPTDGMKGYFTFQVKVTDTRMYFLMFMKILYCYVFFFTF